MQRVDPHRVARLERDLVGDFFFPICTAEAQARGAEIDLGFVRAFVFVDATVCSEHQVVFVQKGAAVGDKIVPGPAGIAGHAGLCGLAGRVQRVDGDAGLGQSGIGDVAALADASVQGMHLHVTADGGQAHVVDLRQHIAVDAVEGQRQANRHRHRDTAAGQ